MRLSRDHGIEGLQNIDPYADNLSSLRPFFGAFSSETFLTTCQAIHMPGDSHATRNRAHAEDLDLDLDGRTWIFRNIGRTWTCRNMDGT